MVDALSRALRLDPVERDHLRDLAAPARRRRTSGAPQQADPGLLRLMSVLDGAPALLLGRRGEVLASNALLDAVLGAHLGPPESFVRWLLLDPAARRRITNWADFAVASVGALRAEVGRHPDDLGLTTLIEELRHADPDVAQWWEEHHVADPPSVRKRVAHPDAGPLQFDIEAVTSPHDPDQRLVVYVAEPDSDTARVLPLLRAAAGGTGPTVSPPDGPDRGSRSPAAR